MKKKQKLLIAGPLPPPAGGISIHIQRLSYWLSKDWDIDFIDESSEPKPGIFHVRSLNPVAYCKKISAADIVFIHSGSRILKKIHLAVARLAGKKIITTIHGYGNRRAWPFRSIDAFFFRMANRIILVNSGIYDKVNLPKSKTRVMHAFLPPVMEQEPALPESVLRLVQSAREKGNYLFCANASRLDKHNGQDLYGLDMIIELMRRVKENDLPVRGFFILSSLEAGTESWAKANQAVADLGLQAHVHLIQTRLSFVKLIEQCDWVLRPTNADGDALTIREALYFGKKVVASDVVSRPEGTILFKTRDHDDLYTKIQALASGQDNKESQQIPESSSYISFYQDLLNEVSNQA